jgi:hypothetical protein
MRVYANIYVILRNCFCLMCVLYNPCHFYGGGFLFQLSKKVMEISYNFSKFALKQKQLNNG